MRARPATPRPRHRWFAAVYDRMAKSDEKTSAPVRAFLAGGASGRVLEIGCGTGLNLPHYRWDAIEGLEATEPDSFMLQRAEARANETLGDVRPKLTLHEAPAEAIPFEDASFDVVVATLVLCTVTEPQTSLSEIKRVLKPGGELRLFEHVRGSGLRAGIQKAIQPVYGWLAAGCQLNRDTEADVIDAGFQLEVTERPSLGPLWPSFVGVARKPG